MIKGIEISIDELFRALERPEEVQFMTHQLIDEMYSFNFHMWRFNIGYYSPDRDNCVRKIKFILNDIGEEYSKEDVDPETSHEKLTKKIYLILIELLKAFTPITERMVYLYIVYKKEFIPKDSCTEIVGSEIIKRYSIFYLRNYDRNRYKRMHGKLMIILSRQNKTTPNHQGLYIKELEEIELLIEDSEKESYEKILSEVRSKSDLT
ncbi:MAG: hypothetical protein ACJATI_003463 [Halioglobus sp.]|jgi:hypothetical protein